MNKTLKMLSIVGLLTMSFSISQIMNTTTVRAAGTTNILNQSRSSLKSNVLTNTSIPATITLTAEKTTLKVPNTEYEVLPDGSLDRPALVKVSGYVKDSNGNPISGIDIGVMDNQGSKTINTSVTKTDSNGYWEVQYNPIMYYSGNWVYATVDFVNPNTGITEHINSEKVFIWTTKY